jgi:predicted RNase H-like HicB family nuclease
MWWGKRRSLDPPGADPLQSVTQKESPMKLIVTLERDETGMIVAECPAVPGCISQGKTEEEALKNIREAIEACIEARAANGMPLTVATREIEVKV